ncbi:hypothetical protein CBS101457_000409 [Exobasidium rhododendri]|nr:hypothetical protein CBS101457_000409 [Exobasidium rhododendri]
MPAARSLPPMSPFPTNGLLPKETTQALSFVKKYPEYDGTGVRVAILDTGVDPAAIGLDGKGKMVDVIDCTGSGDISLTEVKPAEAESKKIVLISPGTQRKLLLSSSLKNPSGKWLIGSQAAYKLWPGDLIKRRKAERKAQFDVENSKLVDSVQSRLSSLTVPKGVETGEANGEEAGKGGVEQASDKSAEKAKQIEELKVQLSLLKDLAGAYADPGPIIEAVVFHDGDHYRVVVGGAEGDNWDPAKGLPSDQTLLLKDATVDMTKSPALADFRFEQQHAQFGEVDLLTYSVNVLTDDIDIEQAYKSPKGNAVALSLVVTSGSHATHVAGIVGANREDDQVKSGVSKGCEIISMKIGDTRLGSMETQQALLRAAQALIASDCDIANMSFGESGAFGVEDKGAFAETLRDYVVRKKDILFISSAGNNGPAISTVGQPGGTTTGVLSIGAYVDAGAMQEAEYALVEENVPSSVTTWCSRGPSADGSKGVDVYAPGAAVTSIPRYCLQATMLANGTSMSSPNACGAIALLLSGMKKEEIPITAARVYKAIRATAKDVNDDMSVPFIQVDKAWDYLVAHKDRPDQDAEFRVSVIPPGKVPGRAGTTERGIYIREKQSAYRLNQYNVTVQPTFKTIGETERAYDLQLPVTLIASEPWIKTPQYLFLGGNGRTFEVRVDATQLPPGLHSATISGYDSDTPGRKLFDVPVTVAKPVLLDGPTFELPSLQLSKGKVDRRFIAVPEGATWAELRLKSTKHQVPGASVRCWVHTVQLEPQQRLPDAEHAYVLALNEGEPISKKMRVKGGMTMELCLAQFFTNAGAFTLEADIEFHGITVSRIVTGRDELTIIGGDGIAKLECMSNLRIETLKPTITFDQRRSFARPHNSTLRPLPSARDVHPNGRQMNELILTYALELKEEKNNITLSLPLSNHLYDSAVPMLLQLFDIQKKRRYFGDVYPKAIEGLEKGSFVVQVQLLNDQVSVLDKLKNMTLRIDQKLSKPVEKVDLYEDHMDQFGSKSAGFEAVKLFPGERKILCLDTNLEGDALPKEAVPGDLLLGTISFVGPTDKQQLRYLVPPAVKKAPMDEDGEKKSEESVADLMTGLVKKLPEKERPDFLARLLKDFPNDLGVLVSKLESLSTEDKTKVDEVLVACEAVLAHKEVDEDQILIHTGSKKKPTSEASSKEKEEGKRLEKARSALILALNRKARALLLRKEGSASAEFEETFERYRRLVDSNDKAFANVYITWSILHNRLGTALQAARKLIKDVGAGTAETIKEKKQAQALERELLQKLGWKLWSAVNDRHRVLDEESQYEGF